MFIYQRVLICYTMVQIRINLDEHQNKAVNVYKAKNDLVSKEEAIKKIISNCEDCENV